MKCFCKILLTQILVGVLLCGTWLSAGAAVAPAVPGDADGDWKLTVMDATRIQRFLAGLCPLESYPEMEDFAAFCADVDGDDRVTILDATRIQRMLAGLDTYAGRDDDFYFFMYDVNSFSFYPDYSSGKAMTGVPVTFRASTYADVAQKISGFLTGDEEKDQYHLRAIEISREIDRDMTYAFYVDGEEVRGFEHNSEMTYTFDRAGTYEIRVVAKNRYNFTQSGYIWKYKVVEPYSLDQPVLAYVGFSDATQQALDCGPLYARAVGGAGSYEYRFSMIISNDDLDGFMTNLVKDPEQYTIEYLDTRHTVARVTQEYSESSVFRFTDDVSQHFANGFASQYMGDITVTARDSEGRVSDPMTVVQNVGLLAG